VKWRWLWSTWTMWWISTNVKCWEILLADCYHVCMCIPRIMVTYVHLGLRWQQLGEISVMGFFGHDNVGTWLKVAHQPWSTWNHASTDQKWKFSVYKQGLWTLCLWPSCGPILKSCLEWVFVVHILLVNLYEQAYGYVFNESSKFSDGRTDT
jgi:hypothetical protein